MEFFGLTALGPQQLIRFMMREDYREPKNEIEKDTLMATIRKRRGLEEERMTIMGNRFLDIYTGKIDGFPYGSNDRLKRMKAKGCFKPVGPYDVFRYPPAVSMDVGWWNFDPKLEGAEWTRTMPRFPQPTSPLSRLLEAAKKTNKFAKL